MKFKCETSLIKNACAFNIQLNKEFSLPYLKNRIFKLDNTFQRFEKIYSFANNNFSTVQSHCWIKTNDETELSLILNNIGSIEYLD